MSTSRTDDQRAEEEEMGVPTTPWSVRSTRRTLEFCTEIRDGISLFPAPLDLMRQQRSADRSAVNRASSIAEMVASPNSPYARQEHGFSRASPEFSLTVVNAAVTT